MRLGTKFVLVALMTSMAASPSFAAFWNCNVPEIDGPAGISALAALISVAMIVHRRLTQ